MKLEDYLKLEKNITNLDRDEIHGTPIWRLVRTQFRWKYREDRPFTVKPIIRVKDILWNNHRSFCDFMGILFSRKRVSNLFFPHPRLFLVRDIYMERFSDSLIDLAELGDDYLIFERHQNGIHKKPRYHNSKVVYLDFIDNLTKILLYVVRPVLKRKYNSMVVKLYNNLNETLALNDRSYIDLFHNIIAEFVIARFLIKPFLIKLAPKRLFFAPRSTYNYVVSYCKEIGVITYELEHGIVLGESDLYSGSYNPQIDPDYFLVFGESNIGPQYGLPIHRVINIGFPYKDYVNSLNLNLYSENVVLVASEPEITDRLLNILVLLTDCYPQYLFYVRCHPQEQISKKQRELISQYRNIVVVDNLQESFVSVLQYQNIIGENSSVLYEAMSLHKRVGRLNFGGLNAIETKLIHGGYYINSKEDFDLFMTTPYANFNDSKEIYSDFQIEIFNSILK